MEFLHSDRWIVFADVTNSTKLWHGVAQVPQGTRDYYLASTRIAVALSRVFAFAREEAAGIGGALSNTMGDGLLIVGGNGRTSPDDLLAAVRYSRALRDRARVELERLESDLKATASTFQAPPLDLKICLDFGSVVSNEKEMVFGDAVNHAARVLSASFGKNGACKADSLAISERAFPKLPSDFLKKHAAREAAIVINYPLESSKVIPVPYTEMN